MCVLACDPTSTKLEPSGPCEGGVKVWSSSSVHREDTHTHTVVGADVVCVAYVAYVAYVAQRVRSLDMLSSRIWQVLVERDPVLESCLGFWKDQFQAPPPEECETWRSSLKGLEEVDGSPGPVRGAPESCDLDGPPGWERT